MAAKPWIGFAVRKAPSKNNLVVQDVAENGPADKAGMRAGDEITTIDGRKVGDTTTFKSMLKNWSVGQSLAVEIQREDHGNLVKKTCHLIVGRKEKYKLKLVLIAIICIFQGGGRQSSTAADRSRH